MKPEKSPESIRSEIAPNQLSTTHEPSVAILLAHYNGEKYIREQIHSLDRQTYRNLSVYVGDDCSTGKSFEHLRHLVKSGRENITLKRNNMNLGYAKNFLAIAKEIKEAQYFAFCDQDDIWREDKIERAIGVLKRVPSGQPALYCSRTEITDSTGEITKGYSPLFCKPPSFSNALMQNIGGGNTMVFNEAASKLICESATNVDLVAHDWWAYLIVSGAGGLTYYDPSPTLKYRQHGKNQVGFSGTWSGRLFRLFKLLRGDFREWTNINVKALMSNLHLLTEENRDILFLFVEARKAPLFQRLAGLKRCGVHRQTFLGNIALKIGFFLGKI